MYILINYSTIQKKMIVDKFFIIINHQTYLPQFAITNLLILL